MAGRVLPKEPGDSGFDFILQTVGKGLPVVWNVFIKNE